YGWRIPFLCSAVLVLVGLYVRLSVAETPAFRRHVADRAARGDTGPAVVPLRAVLRAQWREVLLGGGVMTVLFALFYVATAYMTAYGTSADGPALSRAAVLALGIVASAALALTTVAAGILSDRYGRRRTILVAYALTVPVVLLLFTWVTGLSGIAFGVALAGMLGVYGIAYGPVGAYLPELFATEYRYTGAGVAYNLGGILGGASAPVVAAAIAAVHGPMAAGVPLAGLALVSLLAAAALRPDTARIQEATL